MIPYVSTKFALRKEDPLLFSSTLLGVLSLSRLTSPKSLEVSSNSFDT